jgi:hypothetical protein
MIRHQGSQQRRSKLVYSISVSLALTLLLSLPAFAGQGNAEILISPDGIYAAGASQITYMLLQVADPAGRIIFEASSDGSPIVWSVPAGTPDGIYAYEVRLGKEPKKEQRGNSRDDGPKIRAMVESGSVLIEHGSVVPPTGEETGLLDTVRSLGVYAMNRVMDFLVTPAAADQVIPDDLIIQGSACTGFDCVNNENFSFDTIRLKENNLRLHFEDTSVGTFPTNDWRIIINDSASGGGSYFGVEDSTAVRIPFRIEAGAPANSLYLKNNGRVGLGTSLPAVSLHIADGNTPAVRLDQDGSEGWAPQRWDIAGNEANFFIRDVTNGSVLPFRIQPGTPENTLTLKGGKVGIGTWSPTQELHVEGNAFISGNLELGSSREIKDNIESLGADEAMMTVAMLRPVKFQYKAASEEDSIGFIAEEVPELVATNSRKSLGPMDIVAVLTKVVQEQQKAINELNKSIALLQAEIGNKAAPALVPAVR